MPDTETLLQLGNLKPVLPALLLPPLALLTASVVGLTLVAKKNRGGWMLLTVSLVVLWVVCCHGFAVWLARTALVQFAPTSAAELAGAQVQAIVVLGGGLQPYAPEYGTARPTAQTAARLSYGIFLSRQSKLPVAFSGGVGWGTQATQASSEADVAQRVALDDYGVTLRWLEGNSRDTAENAAFTAPLLAASGVERIALVTHATHMPRALAAFEQMGMIVTPAPTGFVLPQRSALLEWLPSAEGQQATQQVWREVLGGWVARWRS